MLSNLFPWFRILEGGSGSRYDSKLTCSKIEEKRIVFLFGGVNLPTLIQLEYLIAVEHEGHFGRAANSCGVSQPSLSNAIKNLERELGAILFDRAKTPVLPTEQGFAYIQQIGRAHV